MNKIRPPRHAEGSALVLVLFIVLILSLLGLSLVFTTEVEMQLGATEQVIARTFYSAESGLHSATSGILATQDWGGEKFAIEEAHVNGQSLGTRITTTRIHAVGPPQHAPMTMANEGGDQYHTFSAIVQGTAERVGWPNDNVILGSSDWNTPIDNPNVVVQSRRDVTIRYMISPVPTPASASQPYSTEGPVTY